MVPLKFFTQVAPSGTFENVGSSKSALSGMLTYRRPPPTLLAQCLSDCSLTVSCQEHQSSSKTPFGNKKCLESWQSLIPLAPIALRCKSTLCRWTESRRRRCICPPPVTVLRRGIFVTPFVFLCHTTHSLLRFYRS